MSRRWWLLALLSSLSVAQSRQDPKEAAVRALLAIAREYQRLVGYGGKYYRIQRVIEQAEASIN